MNNEIIIPDRRVCSLGLGLGLGVGSKQAPAAGGGGGEAFTAFTDDFSGTLAKWTQVGTSSISGGAWTVTNTTAAIWADYEMPTTAGSWDLDVTLTRTGSFEHQIAVYANATLASVADPYRVNNASAQGYVIRMTSSLIELCAVDTTQTSIKTYTGSVGTGNTVTLRLTIASNGDRTFEFLVNGSSRGTHTVASASLVVGIGTIFGLMHGAYAGGTNTADDVSFDETA